MNLEPSTRQRLLDAGASLFARRGFSGASVRDICDAARANPGAVSYHFGGKRHLYRAVLRHVVERLASSLPARAAATLRPRGLAEAAELLVLDLFEVLHRDQVAARLLQRDLADGGDAAVEALAPLLRSTFDILLHATGWAGEPGGEASARTLYAALAAPLVLVIAGWPILDRTLGLTPRDRPALLRALLRRALDAGLTPQPSATSAAG